MALAGLLDQQTPENQGPSVGLPVRSDLITHLWAVCYVCRAEELEVEAGQVCRLPRSDCAYFTGEKAAGIMILFS